LVRDPILLVAANPRNLGCRIKERVAAGIKSAQKNGTRSGKPIGRPKTIVGRDRVVELLDSGASWATIAEFLGVPSATIRSVYSQHHHFAGNLCSRDGPHMRKTKRG
jgi:DNA invertase Pin-like site-specific DNA recombinase